LFPDASLTGSPFFGSQVTKLDQEVTGSQHIAVIGFAHVGCQLEDELPVVEDRSAFVFAVGLKAAIQ
jgi:hypothetical protein